MDTEVIVLLVAVVALVVGIRLVRHRAAVQRMRDRGQPESHVRLFTVLSVVVLLGGVAWGLLR